MTLSLRARQGRLLARRDRRIAARVGVMSTTDLVATDADSREDIAFFDEYPQRRYCIAERWVVRRRGTNVFPRAPLPASSRRGDGEGEAKKLRWFCAWPELDAKSRTALMKAARRRGFSGRRKT